MSILEDAAYQHYEISNYARPGFASTHNRAYWLGKDYLGIGPSAFSTVGIQRCRMFVTIAATPIAFFPGTRREDPVKSNERNETHRANRALPAHTRWSFCFGSGTFPTTNE